MSRPILTARQRRRPSLTVLCSGLVSAVLFAAVAAQAAGVFP